MYFLQQQMQQKYLNMCARFRWNFVFIMCGLFFCFVLSLFKIVHGYFVTIYDIFIITLALYTNNLFFCRISWKKLHQGPEQVVDFCSKYVLKLTYEHSVIQKFPGGYTPGPPWREGRPLPHPPPARPSAVRSDASRPQLRGHRSCLDPTTFWTKVTPLHERQSDNITSHFTGTTPCEWQVVSIRHYCARSKHWSPSGATVNIFTSTIKQAVSVHGKWLLAYLLT